MTLNIESYRKKLNSIVDEIYHNHETGQNYNKLENLALGDFYDLTFELLTLLEKRNSTNTDSTKSNVSRRAYKELVSNGKKIRVGYVLPFSQILEFNNPRDIANYSSFTKNLNVYYPEFYVEDFSDNGCVFNLFKPSNDIIEIVDKTKHSYCVTGFLIEDGRAIYYDQYL